MKAFFKLSCFLAVLFLITPGCQRELNWDSEATGSLKDAPGECMPPKISGTFYNGITPGSDTTYIELKVDVFTTGAYSIFTDTQNGLRFADSGSFDSKGIHVVKLSPAGTPLHAGATLFTVCFDTSCCIVSIDIKGISQSETIAVNSWSYTDTEKHITYSGPVTATNLLITPVSALLALRKEVTQPGDTSFEISLSFPAKVITTGSYTTDSVNAIALSTDGICVNCAWQVAYKFYSALTTINVTDFDPQTKVIKGTFAGTTIDKNNHISPIKNGMFKAVVTY